MNKDKILIIKKDPKSTIFEKINDIDVKQYYKCKMTNVFFRIIRKLKLYPILGCFLGEWKTEIKEYETVILFDYGYLNFIPQYIKNKNKNIKIILWFWNPINIKNKDFLYNKYIDEFWTFDEKDSHKYNLKCNSQFYSKKFVLNKNDITYDVTFLGRAKDRKNELMKLKETLEKMDITTNFCIIEKDKDLIGYDEYLENISKSKCVLDYNQEGQVGLTRRPMETLFFRKKLITNNKDIINYDFYRPNNIFVLGIDDIDKIREFIDSPYEEVDEEIINYYDFESWLKRFFE